MPRQHYAAEQDAAPALERPGFSLAQMAQAEFIGHVSEQQRQRRKQIPTYPIDNVTPEIVADRDDGVYVEAEHRGGGYRVHVTIADVAAHVRPGSYLAQAAWQRAFTLYGPGWTDPMFPKTLEEQLSLEHQQERLGLTVSITLDAQFRPMHTSFMPVITHPDNSSYAQAHDRMRDDPQFQLMADIAQGVQRSHFRGQQIPWEEIFGHRTLKRVRGSDQLQAMEMVATYMLLANSSVAEFFAKSGLPFLYRNFDESMGVEHAVYSTTPARHTALERMGLKGNYCHFTSPIRRAPDYFNGLMVHHVVQALDQLERQMHLQAPGMPPSALRHALWQRGPELLALMYGTGGEARMQTRRQLQRMLAELCNAALPDGRTVTPASLRQLVSQLQAPALPYSREELQGFAEHMNLLSRSPALRALEKQNEKFDTSTERIEAVSQQKKQDLAHLKPEKFSSLLQAAATTGDMPRGLFEEAVERIRTDRWQRTVDSYTIFVLAQYPGVHRWTALKREVARSIKHDPGLVNGLIDRLEQHIAPATLQEHGSLLPTGEQMPAGKDPSRVCATLLVMRDGEQRMLAAPFYSIGHDQRAAQSHARYSFLEHYAFGQLQPVEQTAVPNLLYAELDMQGAKKRELLDRMAESIGAQVWVHQASIPGGYGMHIEIKGGELRSPIRVEAHEPTSEEAERVALRRMFRHDAFKNAVSRTQNITRDLLNPQSVLEDVVAAQQGSVSFERLTQGKQTGPHLVRATVTLDGNTRTFTGSGPNVDRAMRMASLHALENFDWQMQPSDSARSWVSEMQRRERDEAAGYFVGK